jgi:hypothetical protein
MMRSILLLLAMLPLFLQAQVPQALEFQGIARDANANVLSSQNIALRLSVIAASPNGPVVYQEIHTTTTSAAGLFTVQIGTGGVQLGSFSAIGWAGSAHYLRVEYDATGGNTYLNMGTTQFLSVPYAFVASTTVNCFSVSFNGDTLHQGNGCYVIIPGISAANGGCADADGDGYFNQPGCGTPVDCNDMNALVNPGAVDVCGNGVDEDCNGVVDDHPSANLVWYMDADGDGFGGTFTTVACAQPPGYVLPTGDCDDNDPQIFPGQNCATCFCPPVPNATSICEENLCTITCLPGFSDCDNDPSNGCETEVLSNTNHCGTCNVVCPTGYSCVNGMCIQICTDADGDGFTTCAGDCDDQNPNVYPGQFCDQNCSPADQAWITANYEL